MSKKMLIDASHPEETRVVIVDHNRVEELDFESRNKRQLRGNVYLARVTRVEPSLQAAFIEYGGNRHGFLAFSEIHPDYYQIPYEDRMAILEEEEEHSSDEDDPEADNENSSDDVERDENVDPDAQDAADENDAEVADEQAKVASTRRKRISRRRYKIQEVIKRGQIILVQAVKEERGNKGAAMTTYLSLAGRYCVLMPNTPRGGGISRKISNGSDRKRLKSVMGDLDVPQGMGVIVRTAGAKRTKAEIKRDYEYLSRLWGDIRETTLKSIAPALIHEEGNLVKRSIRDLYNKDIDEVLVEGEEAYKTAKAFIKMLMPSHAKFVKQYKDDIPLFLRYNAESQIENSLSPLVQLKSGGYLVIHPTEALVSVDVNSGRSTKERNVERTALKTNLEAAEEVARQMRLRDLAGLIVIDFIDMDENKNNRSVERKMKDSLSQDRARIQTSRISQFGLMEISRQRRRRSLLEGSTTPCPHCAGVGRKRTVESSALAAIRAVEETAAHGEAERIRLKVSPDVAFYLVNEKRDLLTQVDQDMGVFTEVLADDELIRPHYEIEITEKKDRKGPDPLDEIEKEFRRQRQKAQNAPKKQSSKSKDDDSSDEDESDETSNDAEESSDNSDEKRTGRRRSRRGRRGGRGRSRSRNDNQNEESDNDKTSEPSDNKKSDNESAPDGLEVIDPKAESDSKPKSRRRRATRKAPTRKSDDSKSDSDVSQKSNELKQEADKADPKANEKDAAKAKSRSSRRRKAPSKKSSSDETSLKSDSGSDSDKGSAPVQEEKTAAKLKASSNGRRRAAPSRKPKADNEAGTEADAKPKRSRKAPAKKAATKKAPAKKAEGTDESSKPARKRKAPTKAAKASDKAENATKESTAKTEAVKSSSRRRAAPKKKVAEPSDSNDAATNETPKAKKETAKRRAPATKASIAKSGDAPATEAKPARRRAAPSKASDIATKSPRTRKAPPKKAASEKSDPKPDPDPAPASQPQKSDPKSEAPPKKKKRSWFGLKR
ncbi:Rne/Rng family ribonuclease [Litorimonas haliclonae]|uniref:Rne/Rng family ribonuclease n=1 Tax=Litorimonas haliclonae TaxID=2081977 RepID=UPI0039EF9E4F